MSFESERALSVMERVPFRDAELGIKEISSAKANDSFNDFLELLLAPSSTWAASIFISSITYHFVEQKSAKLLSNLHVSWFITMVELSGVLFCVCIWRISRNGWNLFQRNATIQTYLLLAGCTSVKRGLANIALLVYNLDYPSYVVLKSSKLLAVMAFSVFILQKRYTIPDYLFAGLLALSLILLRIAGADTTIDYHSSILALLSMFVSIIIGAYQNSQQEQILRDTGATPAEVMFFSNIIAVPVLLIHSIISGELFKGFISFSDPFVILILIIRGFFLFWWLYSCLRLTVTASATDAAVVSTFRKLLTVIFSLVFSSTNLNFMHVIGLLCFSFACVVKYQKVVQSYINPNSPKLGASERYSPR